MLKIKAADVADFRHYSSLVFLLVIIFALCYDIVILCFF